jgi:hypothetical protein
MTYPNAVGWTTEQFVEFCKKHDACVAGLAEVQASPSPAIWWETTQRKEWLGWLEVKLYRKVSDLALASYRQVRDLALVEYQRVRVPEWAKWRLVIAPASVASEQIRVSVWADYKRVQVPALAQYQRTDAAAWRNIVPNPFVAPVQEARVQPLGGWSQPETMGSTLNCGRPND